MPQRPTAQLVPYLTRRELVALLTERNRKHREYNRTAKRGKWYIQAITTEYIRMFKCSVPKCKNYQNPEAMDANLPFYSMGKSSVCYSCLDKEQNEAQPAHA